MGTFNGNNKPPSYFLAADDISPDSLSFSGLVSIQDQQCKSTSSVPLNNTKQHDQSKNQSPEFEFVVTKPTPPKSAAAAANSVKTKPKPANLLISIEQLQQQQAISFQTNHKDHHHHHTSSLSTLLSAQSHHGNSQRVGSGNTRKFDGVEKGTKPRSKSSAGKFLETLVSPCRKCRAIEPKVKVH